MTGGNNSQKKIICRYEVAKRWWHFGRYRIHYLCW